MPYAFQTTTETDEHVHKIDTWWRANRHAAPDLFLKELVPVHRGFDRLERG